MKSFRASHLAALLGAFVLAVAVPAAAADAGFYAQDATGWHNSANPSSTTASIPVGGSVTWENRDTGQSHPVQCVQTKSNATCPWGTKILPQKPTLGNPSTVSVTFAKSGTFGFRCAVHPTMTGKVIVGSGNPAPTATSKATQSARPTTRASTPGTSASPSTSAKTTTKAKAGAKKPRAQSSVVAAPSVLGKRIETASTSGRLGGIIPAILLIVLVGAGHISLQRRRVT